MLVGLDGVRKMSKSYDNYIAFNDSPRDMFGKTMSISDDAMWEYFRLLLLEGEDELERMKNDHPMVSQKGIGEKTNRSFLR